MTKPSLLIIALLVVFALRGWAMPPKAVVDDLLNLRVKRLFTTVQSMPKPLQRALATVFGQSKLWIASPNEPMNEMRGIYIGLPNEKEPERRLIFAFETNKFLYTYYEQAHPWSAACLVFPKALSRQLRLIWGGADIRMPPYEATLQSLRTRILKNRLDDSKNFIW